MPINNGKLAGASFSGDVAFGSKFSFHSRQSPKERERERMGGRMGGRASIGFMYAFRVTWSYARWPLAFFFFFFWTPPPPPLSGQRSVLVET